MAMTMMVGESGSQPKRPWQRFGQHLLWSCNAFIVLMAAIGRRVLACWARSWINHARSLVSPFIHKNTYIQIENFMLIMCITCLYDVRSIHDSLCNSGLYARWQSYATYFLLLMTPTWSLVSCKPKPLTTQRFIIDLTRQRSKKPPSDKQKHVSMWGCNCRGLCLSGWCAGATVGMLSDKVVCRCKTTGVCNVHVAQEAMYAGQGSFLCVCRIR